MTEKKIKLWMPVTKNKETGNYSAILSDDSIDRDEEAMSKELMHYWGKNKGLPSLANHENAMEKWVGGWDNLRVVEKDGNTGLAADPWFFDKKANPLAEQIKNQIDQALDKGLNAGISIGAIIHETETRKMNGKDVRVFTKGELLEATWVPIQSNRNANYGHVAKKFGMIDIDKTMEVGNMTDKTFTQKEIDTAVEKGVEDINKKVSTLEKQLADKDSEIAKLQKDVEEAKEEAGKADEAKDEAEAKVEEAKEEVEAEKKKSLEKAKLVAAKAEEQEETDKEEVDKKISEGKVPISRM